MLHSGANEKTREFACKTTAGGFNNQGLEHLSGRLNAYIGDFSSTASEY